MHKAGQSELDSRASDPAHPWAGEVPLSRPCSLWSLLATVSSQLQWGGCDFRAFLSLFSASTELSGLGISTDVCESPGVRHLGKNRERGQVVMVGMKYYFPFGFQFLFP